MKARGFGKVLAVVFLTLLSGVSVAQVRRVSATAPSVGLPDEAPLALPNQGDLLSYALKLRQLADQLELTEEQRDRIRGVFLENREGLLENLQELAENRDELMVLTSDGTFPEERVRELAERQSLLLEELIVGRYRLRAEVIGLLTVAQREKLSELQQNAGGLPIWEMGK